MKESIAKRVRRIIAGGLNSLVTSVESAAPGALMQQAIAEIDEAIEEVRAELGKELAAKHLITRRIAEENRKHEELSFQIELAISKSEEGLAEAGVAKQIDIEAQIPILEASLVECSAREAELESFMHALGGKRRELADELRAFFAAERDRAAASDNLNVPTHSLRPTNGASAQKARGAISLFERVYESATGVAASRNQSEFKDVEKLLSLEVIARKERVQNRLDEIKAKLSTAA